MNTPLDKHDTLILEADKSFIPTWGESRVFWMLNPIGVEPELSSKKKYLAVILVAIMILGATLGELPFIQSLGLRVKLDMFFFACCTAVLMSLT